MVILHKHLQEYFFFSCGSCKKIVGTNMRISGRSWRSAHRAATSLTRISRVTHLYPPKSARQYGEAVSSGCLILPWLCLAACLKPIKVLLARGEEKRLWLFADPRAHALMDGG